MSSGDLECVDCDELEPTLCELVDSKAMQWIFVGGKGGVGKTTTSCSIAVQLAKRRHSVLILSTDPAHNLSDAFSQKFSNTPNRVNGFDNLFAMEIDASLKESTAFQLPQDDEFGLGKILPELLSAFPGIDEALSFAELMQAVQTMNYSVIVFDTAPTGHTLRLLSFPDLLEKAFRKFQVLKDKMSGAFSMINAMSGGADQDEISKRFEHMRAVTTSVREMFRDPTRTTFVCVCIPEFLSLYETERLVQELAKQGIDASYIVVNQIVFPIRETTPCLVVVIHHECSAECEQFKDEVFPMLEDAAVSDNDTKLLHEKYRKLRVKVEALEKSHLARRRMQSKYLSQIQDLYGFDFHVVPMPLLSDEVRGLAHLESFGKELLNHKELPIYIEE